MVRHPLLLSVLLFGGLTAGCSPGRSSFTAPDGSIHVTLVRHRFSDLLDACVLGDVLGQADVARSTPTRLVLPDGVMNPVVVNLMINLKVDPKDAPRGCYSDSFEGAMARSAPNGPLDRMWIDWNKDGMVDANEEAMCLNDSHADTQVFRPVGLPKEIKDSGLVMFVRDGLVSGSPDSEYLGSVNLGGKKVAIAVIDSNLNGRLDLASFSTSSLLPSHPLALLNPHDTIVIDYDGDGRLRSNMFSGTIEHANEAQPLQTSVQLPDGKYYVPGGDLAQLVLTPDPSPTGSIQVGPPYFGLCQVARGEETETVPIVNGAWHLHYGEYTIKRAMELEKDSRGRPWILSVDGTTIAVGTDTSQSLGHGPPYQLVLRGIGDDRWLTLSAWVIDGGHNFVKVVRGPDDQALDLPTYRLSDSHGNVLSQGKMGYFEDAYTAKWRAQPGAHGAYHLDVTYSLPLFGTLTKSIDFKV